MNNTVYRKNVNKYKASRWALELTQRASVFHVGINNMEALIGICTDEDRWMGIYKHSPWDEEWVVMMSEGIMMHSTNFKSQLMSIVGEDDWTEGSCSFVGLIRDSQLLRNNWEWQDPEDERIPEVSDESILDIVQLEIPVDPAEELFKQLPEAIREAVHHSLPDLGVVPGWTSRGDNLFEVAKFCIQVAAKKAAEKAAEKAAGAEADRLWDAWHIADPPESPRRRPRIPEGTKKAPRRKK